MRKLFFTIIVLALGVCANGSMTDLIISGFSRAQIQGLSASSSKIAGNEIIPVSTVEAVPACWLCPTHQFGDSTGRTPGSCPDGKVDIYDVMVIRKAYGTTASGSPHGPGLGQYNCCADICGMTAGSPPDGKVNIYDVTPVRRYFGQTVGSPCANCACN